MEATYEKNFYESVAKLNNTTYRGVYKVEGDNVYTLLNEYDVLLLPTRYITEGVPGILVEAKMSALPAIVSDLCYNSQIVRHGVSGLVMEKKSDEVRCLTDMIKRLDTDRELLFHLKCGALDSAGYYAIDQYIHDIEENI